jgi:hypothetical protein
VRFLESPDEPRRLVSDGRTRKHRADEAVLVASAVLGLAVDRAVIDVVADRMEKAPCGAVDVLLARALR